MALALGRSTYGHGENTTYSSKYSRGLAGVDISRNVLFDRIIYSSIVIMAFVVLCGRITQIGHSRLRHIASLGASRRQQAYWSVESSTLWANIKRYLLYAPLGRKRHNREIQLSSAVNMGTIPSRFQAILITLYAASQIAYCSCLNYSVKEKAAIFADLRGRSGSLAVLNMVPLFILAGRNNPLVPLLHISFDTYNLLHRWLGRIVVLESIVHTIAWAINACDEQNFSGMLERIRTTPFFTYGLAGTSAMTFLGLHSPSPIRHAFYETFLHLHQLAALVAYIGVYMHLHIDRLSQRPWIAAVAVIWIMERTARFLRLLYLNVSLKNGATRATVEALPGEACRVSFSLPRHVRVEAGSHVYVYFPKISLWMSHPFSIAWVEQSDTGIGSKLASPSILEKQPVRELDSYFAPGPSTRITLIIAARRGMTRRLYNRALRFKDRTFQTAAFLEGPYPSSNPISLASYGTVILFSAGAGITHHMLTVRDLLCLAADERSATRQIFFIWSVRSTDHLCWVQSFMDQILRLPFRRDFLTIKLFISKPQSPRDIVSPSSAVQMFAGRCNPRVVLDEVLRSRTGAALVSVCGPGAFADEVRAAGRGWIGRGAVVDFVEEAFTW